MLDIRTEEGNAILCELAQGADVFLTNVRPGGLSRAGLSYEALSSTNPKLVYCSLTGYGLDGPDADKPGFDIASFWSRAGLAHLTVPKGQEPFPIRTAFGDHTTSIAAAAGICAALVEAGRTGKGRLVEASLLRTALYTIGSDFSIQLFFDRISSTKSRHEQNIPIMNFFKSADDAWICMVSRQGNGDWEPICKAVGRDDLIHDERFKTPKGRRANSAACIDLFDEAFGKLTRAEIAQRLDQYSIAWAPVQTLAEVAKDPQVIASGAISQTPSAKGDGSTYASPSSPVRFPGADDGPKGPSPAMGQHTRDVLSAMGKSDIEIDALYSRQVVK